METYLIDRGQSYRGRALFELTRPLVYRAIFGDNIRLLVLIPKGFQTDFASIPRPIWAILPPSGPWRRAAIVHDYLYSSPCPRFLADAVFRHVMEDDQVPTLQRLIIYYGVRLFGWMFRKQK